MRRSAHGFTLLEMMVVLIIVGISFGLVSFNAMPSEQQILQNEAQRISLLLQLARDEAIVRNRPVAFEAGTERYRFLVREDTGWKALSDDSDLREREFKRSPLTLSINPPVHGTGADLRIVFGREPVDKPFVLTIGYGNATSSIHADGIGHFTVE